MDWRQQLARNLSSESKAYGYTLCVWGGGAILINQYSTPEVGQVYAYIGGALLGFVVLALLAFRCLFDRRTVGEDGPLLVASMLHVISTLANLALAHFLAVTVRSASLPASVAFALVGFQVTFGYNVFLLVEVFLARTTARLEAAIAD